MTENLEFKKIKRATMIIYTSRGIMQGLFLYIIGVLFYDHFSVNDRAGAAVPITMILFAFRQSLVALLEVPVEALADTIGRAHVTVLSMAIQCAFFISLAAVSFCNQLYTAVFWASLSAITYALGYTFFNGTFSAWCADTLREKVPEVPFATLASRFSWYVSIGEIFGAMLSVYLFLKGFSFLAFIGGAIIAYATMGYAISKLKEPKVVLEGKTKNIQLATIVGQIGYKIGASFKVIKSTGPIMWIVLNFGADMFMASLIIHLWPVYLKAITGEKQLSHIWILITALCLGLQLAGAWLFVFFNDRLIRSNRGSRSRFAIYRKIYAGAGIFAALGVLLMSFLTYFNDLNLVVFGAVVGLVYFLGMTTMSCYEILINSFIPKDKLMDRATIISSGSMARSILTLLFSIPAGGMTAETSPIGWALPATFLIITSVGTYISIRRYENKASPLPLEESEDVS